MGAKQSAFDQKLKAKEWQWQLQVEMKHLDKEVQKIQKDEARLQKEIHAQAAKGNTDSVQMLAKQVVRSRKAVQRLEKTKASMHGVCLQLTTTIASMSTAASLRLSADVMRQMNAIARMPEVSAVMESMREEMSKCADAEDSMEAALKVDGEDEMAASEVQKILEEMALAKMGPLSDLPAPAAPVAAAPAAAQPQQPQRQLIGVGAEPQPAAPRPAPQAQQPQQQPPAAPSPALGQGYAGGGYGGAPPAGQYGYPGYPVDQVPPAAAAPMVPPAANPAATDDDELMLRLNLLKS